MIDLSNFQRGYIFGAWYKEGAETLAYKITAELEIHMDNLIYTKMST